MSLKLNRDRQEFLGRFKLDNKALQRGDIKSGRAKMIGAQNKETGERVVIKQWRRDSVVSKDTLKEIWRQEIRQLHRLAGCPGAREFMVEQSDSGEDAEGFYLVLSPNQRLPIEALLTRITEFHWLRHPRLPANRQRLWDNLRRVATGLDILHTQGLLHRNLDTWAIFSAGDDIADFQLSGFEWSVRLTGVAARKHTLLRKFAEEDSAVYSFLEDWRAYGRVAAQLLGVEHKTFLTGKRNADEIDAAPYLIPAERDLLLLLLRCDTLSRIDGPFVCEKIDSILQSLRTMAGNRLATLHFTCNVAPSSRLAQAVYDAAERSLDITDIDAMLEFIRLDIASEPLLIEVSYGQSRESRFLLAGRSLTYVLNPYRPQNRGESTWALAYCENTAQRPSPREILGQQNISYSELELIPLSQVTKRFAALQGRTLHWDQQIVPKESQNSNDPAIRQYRGLLLLQLLETLVSAADIFPIVVVGSQKTNDGIKICVQSRSDESRETLSIKLNLKSPAIRMAEIFNDEQVSLDGYWKISDVGVLGGTDDETARWRFVETNEENGKQQVFFEGPGPLENSEQLFLRKSDYVGNESLLRRRIKALRSLKDHSELLEMLADPRRRIRKTHDAIIEDISFQRLDASKQNALREMWAVLPLFLVQGPPGVGKTRLVTELVDRTLRSDPSTRILLSAQSHHAVDHLLDEVKKLFLDVDPADQPLMVRSRPKENGASEDVYDVRPQARLVIDRLISSKTFSTAPGNIKGALNTLRETYHQAQNEHKGKRTRDRSLEALLLRSANVVFSSTNSGDIERLIDERAQFDWTIVEEAAKATGVELIPPLLLSHRRLMIGDHEQLPPYGEERIKKLLEHPEKVREALEIGRSLISRQLRDIDMEELSNEPGEIDELQTVCGEAASALTLFETLVKGELVNPGGGKIRIPIGRQLTFQHRMHPAIARLVSAAFYDDKLLTDPACELRFEVDESPVRFAHKSVMPDSPIIFINMPFGQATKNSANGEKKPNYHNPTEVDAVIEIMSQLRANTAGAKKPTIAVLSPYRQQVRRLENQIRRNSSTRLSHLVDFDFEGNSETPVGTVDSFQGSEADVVILSLVRNNHHGGLRALGFLSDPRRMNVLLSRAKWKLIIVGSLDFLQRRLSTETISKSDRQYFLKKIFETLRILESEKDQNSISLATVIRSDNILSGKL
ncbi:AAA domain protein [Collimonas fungivorans]|uniref:AAA domain protein n=1 Tax=Collimonas fungivorans TaxID=158899 RepID=A0A127P6U1_9BURK|nr:AAA domain-containing protein [Collimonas fungivorans]AMO93493.1 AAA domain protein [Collimonas fungivorans]